MGRSSSSEIFELARHFTVTKLIVSLVNMLIVCYLVERVRRGTAERLKAESKLYSYAIHAPGVPGGIADQLSASTGVGSVLMPARPDTHKPRRHGPVPPVHEKGQPSVNCFVTYCIIAT